MRKIYSCIFLLGMSTAVVDAQTILRAKPANETKPATPVNETKPATPANETKPATPANGAASVGPSAEGAAFRAGDIFELRLSGMPAEDSMTFAQQFTIGGDGFVNVPFSGQVRAAGLTQSQLERAIEKSLIDQKIFTRPTAIINVAPQARFVTIGGQVRAPQRMPWSADLTLNSAISAAGGPADFAGNKIKFTRAKKVSIINKKDLAKNPDQDPKLLPGDQIELL